uniref:30S ribosomal protein S9 n=1 Tax=Ascoseira mirabilis TaxID=76830 RepID=UPI0030015D51|nr:30S ribosomal protein S9 [Ascoseira mirabilis]
MTSKNKNDSYIYGIGRKKESRAIVYLIPFSESKSRLRFEVNGQKAEEHFQGNYTYLKQITSPLRVLKLEGRYKIQVNVRGGGLTGQAESIKLGIARALCKINKPSNFRPILKFEGFLKRDARIKERRKYGLKKARKASQSSKR